MAASASVLASCQSCRFLWFEAADGLKLALRLQNLSNATLLQSCVWRGLIVLFLLLFLETLPSLRFCVLPISSIASLHFISGIMVKKTKKKQDLHGLIDQFLDSCDLIFNCVLFTSGFSQLSGLLKTTILQYLRHINIIYWLVVIFLCWSCTSWTRYYAKNTLRELLFHTVTYSYFCIVSCCHLVVLLLSLLYTQWSKGSKNCFIGLKHRLLPFLGEK